MGRACFGRAATFTDCDVSSLAGALKRLSDSSRSSITHLSIGVLPNPKSIEVLLDSSPNMTSLHADIQTAMWGRSSFPEGPRSAEPDVPGTVEPQQGWNVF